MRGASYNGLNSPVDKSLKPSRPPICPSNVNLPWTVCLIWIEPDCPRGTQVGSEPSHKLSRCSIARHEPAHAVTQPKPGTPSRIGAKRGDSRLRSFDHVFLVGCIVA